ncbi:hypothetical protein HNQ51_003013 [Inhella inkyongensis]|uniref:STAS/SEC14 domain-containing protein n=1 Tax=Inhella inkyongensis TaxID=392593 RepID=A0A840S9L7_9BURK|nr:hypothetical protein [Inhella inkyongensis]MBB5205686.1 hypothetical protein [Inhella inkyongensis]
MKPHPANTDAFAHSSFPAHGRVELRAEWPWMYSRAEGPFNLELVQALGALTQQQFIAMRARGPWVLMARFFGSALVTAEALGAFTQMLQQVEAAGLAPLAVAHVVPPEVEAAELMEAPFVRCFAQAGTPFQQFADEGAARAWLQAKLDSV